MATSEQAVSSVALVPINELQQISELKGEQQQNAVFIISTRNNSEPNFISYKLGVNEMPYLNENNFTDTKTEDSAKNELYVSSVEQRGYTLDNPRADKQFAKITVHRQQFPIASYEKRGLVKIVKPLKVNNVGEITYDPYDLPPAKTNTLGGVMPGNNVNINDKGTISVPVAEKNKLGVVKTGDNATTHINIAIDGTISVPLASGSTLGVVKQGTNIQIASDGKINGNYPDATQSVRGIMTAKDKYKLDHIEEGANNYSLPKASTTVLGGIKVGNKLLIDSNGKLDVTIANVTDAADGLMPHDLYAKIKNIKSEVWTFKLENKTSITKTVWVS